MPLAVVLYLIPLERSAIPLSHGALAHAAAVNLLKCLDSSLFEEIHGAQEGCRPFTTSLLTGPLRREGASLTFGPDHTLSWRLTGLNDAVCEALKRVTPDVGTVRLDQATFRIGGVTWDPASHPDAHEISYGSLQSRWEQARPPITITFQFVSPTTFRQGEFDQPFPDPHLVFRHLWEQWNTHAGVHLGGFPDNFVSSVVLSNWMGETRRAEMGAERAVGFVGRFAYRCTGQPPVPPQLLGLLAQYAFFAGVGRQTTHGLGQTRTEIA